jgi:hypothetical protein
MFASHGEEDEIYPHTTIEIAAAQKKDHNIYSKECKNIKSGFAFLTY